MPYSAVTQPSIRWFRRCGGNLSSTDAAQITRVLPISISADPSAFARKFGVILTARNSSAARLSVRLKVMRFVSADSEGSQKQPQKGTGSTKQIAGF